MKMPWNFAQKQRAAGALPPVSARRAEAKKRLAAAAAAPVTVAASRTPRPQPDAGPLPAIIALLQKIAAAGKPLPRRELKALAAAADALWSAVTRR